MRTAFFRTLTDAALRDRNIMLVTGDLGFGVVNEFMERLPKQFINAGVAEQNMTAIACGLALEGRKVFTYSIGNFATLRCLEQLRNDVCYHEADVTAVAIGGGFSYGQLGMSHFATEDLAILRALPGMRVLAPCSAAETTAVTSALIRIGGPAYLRLDKDVVPVSENGEFEFGKARRLREGNHITLMGIGGIVSEVLVAAQRLLDESGISSRVLAFHSVKPIDAAAIVDASLQTGGIVTVEEHNLIGGFGSAVAEALADAGAVPRGFARMGLNDRFPTMVGDQKYLRTEHGLDADAIVRKAVSVLSCPSLVTR